MHMYIHLYVCMYVYIYIDVYIHMPALCALTTATVTTLRSVSLVMVSFQIFIILIINTYCYS